MVDIHDNIVHEWPRYSAYLAASFFGFVASKYPDQLTCILINILSDDEKQTIHAGTMYFIRNFISRGLIPRTKL